MTYYGQFYPPTDEIIEQYFPKEYIGVAVEIGAAQGIAASNTLHFEQLGWKCLCIEPNLRLYKQLIMNRQHVLNYAISDRNEDNVDFYAVGFDGDETAVSSLHLNQGLMEQEKSTHRNAIVRTVKVNIRTLDFCLKDFSPTIDFVSIDTEGTELDVLKGFSISKYQPKLLIIENNFETPDIEEYLSHFGYIKTARHEINDFYTK